MLKLTLFIIYMLKITDDFLQDRMSQKVPTHGAKLKKFLDASMPQEVMEIVDDCDLFTLVDCSLRHK